MGKNNHVHRYERADIGVDKKYIVYRCNLPDCGHYLTPAMVKGKKSICNRCGEEMTMDALALSLAKPHCQDCTVKKDKNVDKVKELVEELGL